MTESDNDIWVGTEYGLNRYRDGERRGLYGFSIIDCSVNGGTVAFATPTGLYSTLENTFPPQNYSSPPIYESSKITCIGVDPEGGVWAGISDLSNSFLVHVHEGNTETFNHMNSGIPTMSFNDIEFSAGGVMWFTGNDTSRILPGITPPAFLVSYDGHTWKRHPLSDAGLTGVTCNDLAVSADNVVWIATDKGACRFEDGEWRVYTSADGLPDDEVNAVGVAPDGAVWFGTDYGATRLIEDGSVAVETADEAPEEMSVIAAHPNPFNPSTTIEYVLPDACDITLTVYSITGQKVATLVDGPLSAGTHSVVFDGSNLASGVYLARLEAGGRVSTGKMLLVK